MQTACSVSESTTRLGRPIAKASELITCWGSDLGGMPEGRGGNIKEQNNQIKARIQALGGPMNLISLALEQPLQRN